MTAKPVTLPVDGNDNAIPVTRPLPTSTQAVSIDATSAQSDAVESNIVSLCATVDCFIEFGSDPTAAAPVDTETKGGEFLPAKTIIVRRIIPGEKVAVIQADGSGVLYITEQG